MYYMERFRFAPSPTGFLHIGGARVALLNYLQARKIGGKFLLRIEDTDSERNKQEAIDEIIWGLQWLGLQWDENVVMQSQNIQRHIEYVDRLIAEKKAFYCYEQEGEIEKRKNEAQVAGIGYVHRILEQDLEPKIGISPVVRFKVDHSITEVVVRDVLHEDVVFNTKEIEDFVILRNDGTPIYMLSVVCDDIDMNVSCVIRGDDHLTNTPKQVLLYRAFGASVPRFCHVPLLHGMDGKKLSKRHGALGVREYQTLGYLPEAVVNYLLSLGFNAPNEIMNFDEMVNVFCLDKISAAPARFDFEKLNHINGLCIQNKPVVEIYEALGYYDMPHKNMLLEAIELTRKRFDNLNKLKDSLTRYLVHTLPAEEDCHAIKDAVENLKLVRMFLKGCNSAVTFDADFKTFLKGKELKFSDIGPALRLCLIGVTDSVSISDIVKILGFNECVGRIEKVLNEVVL